MKKKKKILLILLLLQVIVLFPIFFDTLKLGHDMKFHLANIDLLSRYLNFDMWKQGFHIMPEMASNLGYGIGIFYPILPHLLCAIINRIYETFNVSTIWSLYTMYFIISYGSSILVYLIASKVHQNKILSIISACIYVTMPYFLGNLFIRFALNEIMAFFFFLVIILSLFYLIQENKKRFYILFVLGYIGMISSHLMITIFGTILLMIFVLIYRNELLTKVNIKAIVKAVIIVSIWVLPDVILLLIHQLDGGYIVFGENTMTSLCLVNSERLNLQQLFLIKNNYDWDVAYHIPIIVLFLSIVSIVYYIKNRKNLNQKSILFFIIFGIISLFMTSILFPWNYMPDFLLMVQFPWRLEGFFIIAISVLAPIYLLYFKNKNSLIKFSIITLLLITISVVPFISSIKNRIYLFDEYTVDNGMGHQHEYLPLELDYDNIITDIISENSNVKIIKNDGANLTFSVSNIKNKETFILPKLFYYGYQLVDKNGKHYELERSRDGYLEVVLDKNGTYILSYTGTISYQILRWFRISMVIVGILYTVIYVKKENY